MMRTFPKNVVKRLYAVPTTLGLWEVQPISIATSPTDGRYLCLVLGCLECMAAEALVTSKAKTNFIGVDLPVSPEQA